MSGPKEPETGAEKEKKALETGEGIPERDRAKVETRSRDWCVTQHLEASDSITLEDYVDHVREFFDAGALQMELGEHTDTGIPHIQAFFQGKPKRFSTVVRFLESILGVKHPYVDKRRGTVKQAVSYAQKDDTWVEGTSPVVFGEINMRESQGKREDLLDLRKMVDAGLTVDEILLEDVEGKAARYVGWLDRLVAARDAKKMSERLQRDLHCTFIWGKTGVGKTRYALEQGRSLGKVARIVDYRHPWDMVDIDTDVIVCDEYNGQLDLTEFLTILEGYGASPMRARYRNRWPNYSQVYVLSNTALNEMYSYEPSERRRALFRRFDRIQYMFVKQFGKNRGERRLVDIDQKKYGAAYLVEPPISEILAQVDPLRAEDLFLPSSADGEDIVKEGNHIITA